MSAPNKLLWALIGLLLTIGGTFLEAFVTNPPWDWSGKGIHTISLGVTYQIGAVLLTGCLGGKSAGALSQIAYIVLGFLNIPVFTQGGGISYVKQPSFGYLLGFIIGAWICGFLAFRMLPRVESLAFSCICGLFTIHICGLSYLIISNTLHWVGTGGMPLMQAIMTYTIAPLPGQLAVVCAVTVLAFALRQLMFY